MIASIEGGDTEAANALLDDILQADVELFLKGGPAHNLDVMCSTAACLSFVLLYLCVALALPVTRYFLCCHRASLLLPTVKACPSPDGHRAAAFSPPLPRPG